MPGKSRPLQQQPFRYYLRAHPRVFLLGVIALFLTNLFDVLTPLGLKAGIDALEARDASRLAWAVGAYALMMVGVTVFRFCWRIFFGRFHHTVAEDLRNRIYDKLSELGATYYNKTPVGQIISLLSNDVNTFRMAIGPGLLLVLDAVFYSAMILPLMISLSWAWTWKTLIALPLLPFLIRKMENLLHERSRHQQDRLGEMSGRAAEIVSGIRPIKSFAQEQTQAQSFNQFSRRFEHACNLVAKADSAFHPAMQFAVTIGSVSLLWFCTADVVSGAITLGTFVAFHEYIKRMVWPMSAIGMGISMIEQGRASFDRIRELLDTPTDIPDTGIETIKEFTRLEIRSLSFRYPGANDEALQNLDLTINAGETIGLVGPVGAGKSTLVSLLCRVYPAARDSIRVNGIDLADITRASLSETIALVPQDAFLFSRTIAENVALGFAEFPGIEPVRDVATTVNIDHEIQSLPRNYDSPLGERGVNLSGGQKQRLTIARALIRKTPVVIFDDSLSAVDGKTEQAIVAALKDRRARYPQQTVILVSHRLATLKHADRIIVLDKGRIEAEGQHQDLIRTCATYQRLHQLQSEGLGQSATELTGANP